VARLGPCDSHYPSPFLNYPLNVLAVPVMNTQRAAVFDDMERLPEDVLDKFILAMLPALVEGLDEGNTVLVIVRNHGETDPMQRRRRRGHGWNV